MKSNSKFQIGAAVLSLVLTGVVVSGVAAHNGSALGYSVWANQYTSYSCGSIHFGMDDDSLVGNWSNSGSTWAPQVSEPLQVVNFATIGSVAYQENCAVKFNTSSIKDSTLTITFNYNILQCTVYAAAWKDSTAQLKVNTISQDIDGCDTLSGSSGDTVTYKPYIYVLPTETNILALQALNERVAIGDIAMRITTPIVPEEPPVEESTLVETNIDFSKQGYSNAEVIDSVTQGAITVRFNKNTGNTNPAYYDTGSAVRAYGGNNFTVTSAYVITKIQFTFGSGDKNNQITTDIGSYADGIWTGESNRITFTIGGTSGHRRIQSIVVTYQEKE